MSAHFKEGDTIVARCSDGKERMGPEVIVERSSVGDTLRLAVVCPPALLGLLAGPDRERFVRDPEGLHKVTEVIRRA